MSWIGVLTAPSAIPVRESIRAGTPNPTASIPGARSSTTISTSASSSASCDSTGVGRSVSCSSRPEPSRTPARIFVPPRSIPMTRLSATPAGTLLRRMAPDDKPYRVYKGGRVKGKVPAVPGKPRPQPNRAAPKTGGKAARASGGCRALGRVNWKHVVLDRRCSCSCRARRRLGRSPASSRSRAASRPRTSGSTTSGAHAPRSRRATASCSTTARRSSCSAPTARRRPGRSGDRHADSIMLVRTDPSHHRLAYLSIPRDLLVQRARRRQHEDQRRLPGRRRAARDQDGARASPGSRSTTW